MFKKPQKSRMLLFVFGLRQKLLLVLLIGALGAISRVASAMIIAEVDFVSGNSATIDSGSGPVPLVNGDSINIGDVIHTNSDRVQFSYTGTYSSIIRMGTNSIVGFEIPPSPLVSLLPNLTFSPHFQAGEVYARGNGDGKYRTTCYIRRLISMDIFLRPGSSPNEDLYYALDSNFEVFEYQPVTSSDQEDWMEILSLNASQMASLTFNPDTGFHTAGMPQSINASDLNYIMSQYTNDELWIPEPATLCLFALGGLLLRRRKSA